MKKHLFPVIVLACLCSFAGAQSPSSIPYQAVARDASGNLLVNKKICVQFGIYNALSSGNLLYEEHDTVTTNSLGLFTLRLGQGSYDGGSYASLGSLDWGGTGSYIAIGLDLTGNCSGYVPMGARTQMLSVPYALYAGSAGSAGGSAGGDLTGAYPSPRVTGLEGDALPSLSVGALTYNGTAWVFNNSYLSDIQPLSTSGTGGLTMSPSTYNGSTSTTIGIAAGGITSAMMGVASVDLSSNVVTNLLSISQGGTNGSATPTGGAIAYGNGSEYAFSAAGTGGQVLLSGGGGEPTWASQTNLSVTNTLTQNGSNQLVSTVNGVAATALTTGISGDVTGNLGASIVAGLKGDALPSLSAGALTYNGTAWVFNNNYLTANQSISLSGDVTGSGATSIGATVGKIDGASVPAAGGLTTGNVLQVNGASSLTYSPVNLAGGNTYISGTLPVANGGTGVATAAANTVFAGPSSGDSAPYFRALTAADMPSTSGLSVVLNNIYSYTSSSTYTPLSIANYSPAKIAYILIDIWGGGGGGGATNNSSSATGGGPGQTSYFSTAVNGGGTVYVSAAGGGGGYPGSPSNGAAGGAGGGATSTPGDVTIPGAAGAAGQCSLSGSGLIPVAGSGGGMAGGAGGGYGGNYYGANGGVGSGAGGGTSTTGSDGAGGGGGAGGYAIKRFVPSTGTTYYVTIGGGGTAGSTNGATGQSYAGGIGGNGLVVIYEYVYH